MTAPGLPVVPEASNGVDLFEALLKWGDPAAISELRELISKDSDGLLYFNPVLVIQEHRLLPCYKLRSQVESEICAKLLAGELVATGHDSRSPIDSDPVKIPGPRWRELKPNFKTSTAIGSGFELTGILVYERAEQLTEASRNPCPTKFAPAKIREWYRAHLAQHIAAGTVATREEDYDAARQFFGTRISRRILRNLRDELAPPEWRQRGRRKSAK